MAVFSIFKNTVLLLFFTLSSCGNHTKTHNKELNSVVEQDTLATDLPIIIAANRTGTYLPLLKGKRVGIVANQTSVIFKGTQPLTYTHIVDSLLAHSIDIQQVFAPEHGFRGEADAGEKVSDGKDEKTGLPIISLYGKNRKPSKEQLRQGAENRIAPTIAISFPRIKKGAPNTNNVVRL